MDDRFWIGEILLSPSEDTLDFVSFRLQQILQHLVHFGDGLDEYRNLSQTLGRLV